MKKKTMLQLQKSEQLLARAFIDRVKTSQVAVLEEQRKIIKELNVTGAYLYNYYVSICMVPTWDLTDDNKVAKQCGLTPRKVADTRRALTALGWIRFDVFTRLGVKYGLWYIGKEVVAAKFNSETTLEEFNELGIITDEEMKNLVLTED